MKHILTFALLAAGAFTAAADSFYVVDPSRANDITYVQRRGNTYYATPSDTLTFGDVRRLREGHFRDKLLGD